MDGTRLVALMFVTLALAGCADAPAKEVGIGPSTLAALQAPEVCATETDAFVHGVADAKKSFDGPVGFGCLAGTTWGTGEPSLGVSSDGTLFLYPAYAPPAVGDTSLPVGQFTGIGVARSQDEGTTFQRLTSEVAGLVNYHPYTADPYMFLDPYTDRLFVEDLLVPPFNCANLSYSDDQGETWTQGLAGCQIWDHVGYASGPPVTSSLDGYAALIQRCAIALGATTVASQASGCQKSLDGGDTWESPTYPFMFGPDGLPYIPSTCFGAIHHPFIDHRGWTWVGRDWCGTGPWVAVSKDEGASWAQHQVLDGLMAGHDVGVGVDTQGTVFAHWITDELRPVVSVSKDDGATWSDPIDIAPPGVVTAGMPNIAPGGAGKAAFSYVAEIEGWPDTHGVVTAAFELDSANPVFQSAIVSSAAAPLQSGSCASGTCSGQADFLDVTIGPDGSPWGSFTHNGLVAGGRLLGAPTLWDADDENGPYLNS